MYRTKKLLKWVDETVIRYALYLKIEKPKIYFDYDKFIEDGNVSEYEQMILSTELNTMVYLGCVNINNGDMFLNIDEAYSTKRFKKTRVHELTHIKLGQTESHTVRFYEVVEETLKKG